MLTGIATGTSICTAGDITCQYLEYRLSSKSYYSKPLNKFEWNYIRTMKYATVGFCLAPQLVSWYKYIQRKFPDCNSGKRSLNIASRRMFIDQLFFGSWSVAFSLGFTQLLNEGDINNVSQQINSKWIDSYKVNLLLWPPAQFLNFWLIPPYFRVLCTNITAFVWNTYLSFKAFQDIEEIKK